MIHDGRAFKSRCVVLVEGDDDARFFSALVKTQTLLDSDVAFVKAKGVTNFQNALRATVAAPGYGFVQSTALLRDADNDANAALSSMQSSFQNVFGERPPAANSWHTLLSGNKIAAILVPPTGRGLLETLIAETVSDELLTLADEYLTKVDKMDAGAAEQFSDSEQAKRRIHTLMAVGRLRPRKIKPGLRVGEAAEAGLWDLAHKALLPYKILFEDS